MNNSAPLMTASGRNGILELFPDKIRIKRSGAVAFLSGLRGDKDIPIAAIGSVQLKNANMLTNGFIQFAYSGGKEASKGTFNAASDENTIMFTGGQQNEFIAIRDAIQQRMAATRQPSQPALSPADEIRKLGALRDEGLISADEFEAKKRQLLGL